MLRLVGRWGGGHFSNWNYIGQWPRLTWLTWLTCLTCLTCGHWSDHLKWGLLLLVNSPLQPWACRQWWHVTVLTLLAVLAVLAHVQMAVLASLAQGAPATTTIAAVTGQMGVQGDTKLPPLTDRGWGLPVFVYTLLWALWTCCQPLLRRRGIHTIHWKLARGVLSHHFPAENKTFQTQIAF